MVQASGVGAAVQLPKEDSARVLAKDGMERQTSISKDQYIPTEADAPAPVTAGLAALFLLLLLTHSAWADFGDVRRALADAAALEASGKLEAAVTIYRDLHSAHPRRSDILYRLTDALSKGGRLEEVVDLLEPRIRRAPRDVTALSRLGDALYALGRKEEAMQRWQGILLEGRRPRNYGMLAEQYRKHHLYEEAAAIYRKGRTALGRPSLFARELAVLAERRALYPEAVSEYLRLLGKNRSHLRFVESRLRQFAKEGVGRKEILTRLRKEVQAHPDDDVRLELLVDYAIQSGQAGPALEVLTSRLKETNRHWSLLSRLAETSLDHGDLETASVAYRSLLDRFDRPVARPRLLLALARAEAGRGLADEARRLFSLLLADDPERPEADEARYRLGDLMIQAYGDATGALKWFQAVVDIGRRSSWRYKALFRIAEEMTRSGAFQEAERVYSLIASENAAGQGEARFRMAEARFLSGDFEAALTVLKDLLSGPATSYALNDALELAALIEGGLGDPAALKRYAVAMGLDRTGQRERALEQLEGLLVTAPEWDLKDRVVAAMAGILEVSGRYPEVLQAWRQLIREIPWSPLCPSAMIAQARVYEDRLGQYHEARRAYEALIAGYPGSPEADEARVRLRMLNTKLRGAGPLRKEAG